MAAARAFFYWPLMSLTQLLLPRKKWGRKKATTEATRTIGNRDAASQSPSSTCCVQDPFWITRFAHMLMAFWDDQQLSRKSVPYARDAWQPSFIWPSLANWVFEKFFQKSRKYVCWACIRKALAEFEIFSVPKLSIILSEVWLECIGKKKHIYLQQKMHFNLLFQTFSEAHF